VTDLGSKLNLKLHDWFANLKKNWGKIWNNSFESNFEVTS